jgi:hypothetical protein
MIKKFYFPLTIRGYERGYCGWLDGCEYNGKYADIHRGEIERKFDGYNDDDMVDYFHGSKSVQTKLQSMIWGFESVVGCLYGKVNVTLSEDLTTEEVDVVKDYICGQNSDGLGEGFEQQEIRISYDEVIQVSFWHSGDDYWIYDEDEFNSKIRSKL